MRPGRITIHIVASFPLQQGDRKMNMRKSSYLLALLAIVSLLITQCAPAAPTAAPATQAPAATEAPATGGDYTQAPRNETVIFDIDGGKVADPTLWNPFVPGSR